MRKNLKRKRTLNIIQNLSLLFVASFFFLLGIVLLFYIFTPLPELESLSDVREVQSITVTDRYDEVLFDFSEDIQRQNVSIEDVSENMILATLAIEDSKFYEHIGIRPLSFLRAVSVNITTGSFSQGGSTITQQVIKNLLLTKDKRVVRKLKEFILAPKLELNLTKDEILELYLNTISYGGTSYGIGEASRIFFEKKPIDLTVAESAYLAAIPRAPSYYSPFGSNQKDLEKRKNIVLKRMLDLDYITREEYKNAIEEEVFFIPQKEFSIKAPHFVFFIREQLEKEYGGNLTELEGEIIKTTLDYELQSTIEGYVKNFAETVEEKYDAKNLASVVLDAKTGEILAMVGSKDFFDDEIDGKVNITTSKRQPGSTFKPFAYATAFKNGYTKKSIIFDVETQFNPNCEEDRFESSEEDGCYSPVNYDGRFRGPVSMKNALAQSINIPAVKTLYLAGVGNTLETARSAGITTLNEPERYGLSLVLGGAEVTPLELANAYSIFANDGDFVKYRWLLDSETERVVDVLPEEVAQDINEILSDDEARAPIFGRNSALSVRDISVAAKTGTTNNSRDIWVVGYTPEIIVLVWGGNSKGELLTGDASGFSLAPLFNNIMKTANISYGTNIGFKINTKPNPIYPEVLNGIWWSDNDKPHSILHFVNRGRPQTGKPLLEDDSQYEHWEFSVNSWSEIEGSDLLLNLSKIKNKKDVFSNNNDIIYISIPKPQSIVNYSNFQYIEVLKTGNLSIQQYDFYINDELISSSHNNRISFSVKDYIKPGENITIKVVGYGGGSTYTDEKTYTTLDESTYINQNTDYFFELNN